MNDKDIMLVIPDGSILLTLYARHNGVHFLPGILSEDILQKTVRNMKIAIEHAFQQAVLNDKLPF